MGQTDWESMSVELISVLIAVLAIGGAQSGLILTSNRGLREDMARMEAGLREDMKQLSDALRGWSIAKPSWKGCWKDCARPSPDGPPPAKDGSTQHLRLQLPSREPLS